MILEPPTLIERLKYYWHLFRMKTSRRYRDDWNKFENDLRLAFKLGIIK